MDTERAFSGSVIELFEYLEGFLESFFDAVRRLGLRILLSNLDGSGNNTGPLESDDGSFASLLPKEFLKKKKPRLI